MARKIQQVRKRDGRLDDFDPDCIRYAIHRAFIAMREEDGELAEELMGFIQEKSKEKSMALGRQRGSYPNFREPTGWLMH